MIATILTFLSEKVVAVVVTTIVVVAAVPTLIVAINGNTITITTAVASESRHHDEDERARIIVEVNDAANAVIVKLNGEEASCDAQIAQLASKSKLSATATAARLQKGKDDFHAAVAPFLKELTAAEDELEHLSVITTQTEQLFLVRINEVNVVALGDNGQVGALVTICQVVIIQISQVIVVAGGDTERDADIEPT